MKLVRINMIKLPEKVDEESDKFFETSVASGALDQVDPSPL